MTEAEIVTNVWQYPRTNKNVDCMCFVTDYGLVELSLAAESTFKQLKEKVLDFLVKKYKNEKIDNFNKFQIIYVSENTCHQEVNDDNIKLSQLDFFIPIFRFVDPERLSSPQRNLDNLIKKFNLDLDKTSIFYKDIHQQRLKLSAFAYSEIELYEKNTKECKFVKCFPQQIKKVDGFSTAHQAIIVNKKILKISVFYESNDKNYKSFILEIPIVIVIGTLKQVIFNKLKELNENYDQNFIIKLAGKRIFMTGEYISNQDIFDESTRLIDYLDIQNKITNSEEIVLTLVKSYTEYISETGPLKNNLTDTPRKSSKVERNNIWNLEKCDKFNISIKSVEADGLSYFMLKVGLFYGDRLLDSTYESKVFPYTNKPIDELVKFEIPLNSLPLNTKICIVLYGSRNKSSEPKPKYMNPEAWVNLCLYDHCFHIEEHVKISQMYITPITRLTNGLNPLGTSIPYLEEKNKFTIEYNFSVGGKSIFYPMDRQMKNTLSKSDSLRHVKKQKELSDENYFKNLHQAVAFSDLTVEQKEKLWQERTLALKKFPNLAPKILQSMPDFGKKSICKAFMLLRKAPLINPELSLELFQLKYCHPLFRSYLVRNLEQFSDEKLELYMTQIIEGLKQELNVYNDLTTFLLKKAIHNKRLAHFLIWHLLADRHNPECTLRNALIVEAYCRVKPDHLEDILKQVNMITMLNNFYEVAGINNVTDKSSLIELFKKYVSSQKVKIVFQNLSCPLDPSYYLKKLKIEECRVMESKKKPLLLVFESEDEYAQNVKILYKYGDDLRQDILVLSCMKIIDRLCEKIDPHIKFTCYDVLNTGNMEGMIHLVQNATTLGNIQAKKGFKQQILHEWFQEQLVDENIKNDIELETGCRRFAASCAAYSVLTYILGIGDRHNDNIMLHKSGRLFHIDFGHILGNFKSFYGIKRERAPFIMTKDFLYFATNGKLNKADIKKYRDYCADLFVKIRESAYLILLPFILMTTSGLPELQSENDVSYIFNAIDVTLDTQEAKQKFEEKFSESYEKSWSTELNFKAHNIRVAGSSKTKASASAVSNVVFEEGPDV